MSEWKYIKGSKFYQVSDKGEVRCVGGQIMRKDGRPYTIKPNIMKPYKLKSGYLIVDLKIDIKKKCTVHRILMEAFCPIENMDELQVNHIDGNKSNNQLSNLEWCTRKENMRHAIQLGLFNPQNRYGEKHPMCKLSDEDVSNIRLMLNSRLYTQTQIAKIFDVSDCTISEIKTKRKRKK